MRPRVVVVGAGHLGAHHLRKLAAEPSCTLVGVVDSDPGRLARAQAEHGIPGHAELFPFAGQADAAVVATPTASHLAVARAALGLGWHVLVEKPLADSSADAACLVAAAQSAGRLLQVGHVERFNPAVEAALAALAGDGPRYIVSERLGPFTGRSADVDVVLDLMIHDLEIVAAVMPAALIEVRAIGVPVFTNAVDMASARLGFADGAVAQLSAGRASMEPSRKLRFFSGQRYMSVDCASREVKSVIRLPGDDAAAWPQISGEALTVAAQDPLAAQDADFMRCIREQAVPRVDGQAGLGAVRLAEVVKAAILSQSPDVGGS